MISAWEGSGVLGRWGGCGKVPGNQCSKGQVSSEVAQLLIVHHEQATLVTVISNLICYLSRNGTHLQGYAFTVFINYL